MPERRASSKAKRARIGVQEDNVTVATSSPPPALPHWPQLQLLPLPLTPGAGQASEDPRRFVV
jgi:hypothetical protein